MKFARSLAFVLAAVALCVIVYATYKTWDAKSVYRKGNASYDELSAQIHAETKPTPNSIPEKWPVSNILVRQVDIPALDVDFGALANINSDIIGWLYCPDTVIDYPVAGAYDYEYYISHLPDGTYNANGTLFLDYHNAWGLSDKISIIYGHHMQSGRMFGTLCNYKEQGYYEQHKRWYLYTPDENYCIELLYGFVIPEADWQGGDLYSTEKQEALLTYARENTTFQSESAYSDADKLLAFSTCSYEYENARYVVLGRLIPEFK